MINVKPLIFKMRQIGFFGLLILVFCSCNGQSNSNVACKKKFKQARDLVYTYPAITRQSALDSALSLTNECMQCDSIRQAVVDLKITLLVAMKKYQDGINFIDSLKESDFVFAYKKSFTSKALQALDYESKKDTVKRNLIYEEMASNLEQYIKKQNVSDKEFKEAYTELFAVKDFYLSANQINAEVVVYQTCGIFLEVLILLNFRKQKNKNQEKIG
jgi:hypothetical protein